MILKSMGWTSAITGVGALLITLMLLAGILGGEFEGGGGMAILGVGIWGVLLSVVGMITGFVAYFIASSNRVRMTRPGQIGLWAAGAAGTIIALAMFLG